MKLHSKDFRVPHHKKIDIIRLPTIVKPFCESKKEYKNLLEEHIAELSKLQQLHYASNRYALLLIFQGMDSAGKDGAIRHIMSGVNPEGCEVFSFKQPSAEELEHDFLWRTTCRLPERGRIGIFNRSYYEEVLIRSRASRNSPKPGHEGSRGCLCRCWNRRSAWWRIGMAGRNRRLGHTRSGTLCQCWPDCGGHRRGGSGRCGRRDHGSPHWNGNPGI